MISARFGFFLSVVVLFAGAGPAASAAPAIDVSNWPALEYREIGPYRGGRCAAVTGVTGYPDLYYMGTTGGGVWKTEDAGRSWRNVSDGYFGGSIGAVAVSEWDPNVVYVGGGEKTVRGNVSHGDGLYKSTDAGRSWKKMGLEDSRHITRIRIHPKNADILWVAALGHLFGPNPQRGVYKSSDGGASFKRVLSVSDSVGAVDLVLDPTNPRILYATMWRVLRTPYSLESGGPGSGLWKSADGGDTWTELTGNPGLPKPPIGICGITVSPTNPDNLYAIVEAEMGGVFRSRDAGKTWTNTNSDRDLRQRAWYYSRIYADPGDEESVYVLNVQFHRSTNGGKSFGTIGVPHVDNHDLWIAPEDPQRMIESNDGGANVSFDGGKTWSTQGNQPTAQMYRVSTDNAYPYRLLGGQQDNSAIRIRSRSLTSSAIGDRDWEATAGGESGHIVAKPDDPDVVFGGSYGGYLTRYDHRTGEERTVNVWPDNPMGWGAADLKYRFQWNYPIFFSPHDPNVMYAAGNVLFRSRDEGLTWDPVSPDLTRNDKTKQAPSGGPITKDNTSVEYYCTIFAALESPHEPGVLWTGSDDGLVQVSRDNGATWKNVTPKGLPEWAMINSVDAHPFEKGGLYLAATRYKLDDFTPYLFKTTDYGASWTRIDAGIDRTHFTRVLRADPDRRGLLYAGTERGVHVSFDDGASWGSLQRNLPIVPITDLAVKERDLVVATQGRGYWILDDLSPLHQATPEVAKAVAADPKAKAAHHFFAPRPTVRSFVNRSENPGNRGTNPRPGVTFLYALADSVPGDVAVRLQIFDSAGDSVHTFTRKPVEGGDGAKKDDEKKDEDENVDKVLHAARGMNRYTWDLRHSDAERFDGMVLWSGGLSGPRALPGRYTARLTVGDWSAEVPFEIVLPRTSAASAAQVEEQFRFLLAARDKLTETHRAIGKIRDVRDQLNAVEKRLKERESDEAVKPLLEATKALRDSITAVESALYQTKNKSRQDPLNFPIKLNDKLAGLKDFAESGDGLLPRQAHAVRDELVTAIDAELAKLNRALTVDLPKVNRMARDADVPLVYVEPEKPSSH